MTEREIVEPVALCTDGGRLHRAAVGWSRRPLHRCNLSGRFARKKRWDYWCVTDEKWLIALFVADVDYLALGALTATDLESGRRYEKAAGVPFAALAMPDDVGGGSIFFDHFGLKIELRPEAGATRLRARARGFSLEAVVEQNGESLNVVVPWDDDHFQFTSKQIGLPARGKMVWGDREIDLNGFGALDFGRGVWPRRTRWNWAAAARGPLAFNLGGRWTDGTGATENGLFVDGKLHKIGDAVAFERTRDGWRIQSIDSNAIDLTFKSLQSRLLRLPLGLASARLDWSAGRFAGRILDHTVADVFGWAEDFTARW